MHIPFLNGESLDVNWSGDTCHIRQSSGPHYAQVELPAEHIFDLIAVLQTIAKEHSAANGEPPAGN